MPKYLVKLTPEHENMAEELEIIRTAHAQYEIDAPDPGEAGMLAILKQIDIGPFHDKDGNEFQDIFVLSTERI